MILKHSKIGNHANLIILIKNKGKVVLSEILNHISNLIKILLSYKQLINIYFLC